MKAVIQRVTRASVTVNGTDCRAIGPGLVIFIGIGKNDTLEDTRLLADRITGLRIFPNTAGKFDRSVKDANADILAISQFTLYANTRCGRRPDFTAAASPDTAKPLYEAAVRELSAAHPRVRTGEFGADMLVEIHNDGPVTITIDTEDWHQ